MKKTFILMAAAAAMALTACSDNEKIQGSDEIEIGFNDSFIGKQTRNAGEMTTSTLATDGNTMEVWGWKQFSTNDPVQVFNEQEVRYNSSSSQSTTKWEYSPLKYWDKAANYKFYAVAPYNSSKWAIDASSRKISLALDDEEQVQVLEDMNGTSAIASGDATAVDYLVATYVTGKATDLMAGDVAFAFNHILSKFEVLVKTTDVFASGDYPNIELNKLSVQLEGMLTDYDQKTEGAVASGDAWSGTAMEATSYTCFDADGTKIKDLKLTKTAKSLAKYLVAPTEAGISYKDKYTVSVEYTINYSASEREKFVSDGNKLANLTKFEQDTYNTLTVTVGPTAIYFDVESVGGWSEGENADVSVE